jgi:2Fe-2S ferredoxin
MSLFGKKQTDTAAVTYISYAGDTRQVAVPIGDSVMEGAIKNGIDGIVAECGGACQCATCHVYVDEAFLGRLNPIQEDEDEMLNTTFSPRRSNSRLSCQIPVTKELDGLIVRTPEAQQ